MDDGCRWRLPAYLLVASTFFVQGWVVWTDAGSDVHDTPLSAQALEGQAIFRANNCQSCHQLFGAGGYLGPDLTNATRRVPAARYATFLDEGAGAMPAFHLDGPQRDAVWAYLSALDSAGLGVPTLPEGETGPLYADALARWQASGEALPAEVATGAAVATARGCGGCHLSFAPGGAGGAPDLGDAVSRLGAGGVRQVVAGGRGGMPNLVLSDPELDSVVALLTWVDAHQDTLRPSRDLSPLDAPWFAYRDTK